MRSTQIAYVMCSVRFASHSEAPYTVATSVLGTRRIAYPDYADHQMVASASPLYP